MKLNRSDNSEGSRKAEDTANVRDQAAVQQEQKNAKNKTERCNAETEISQYW